MQDMTRTTPDGDDPQQSWQSHAETLGDYARSNNAPLAFLIGAGCSISSSCPSLAEVESTFDKMPVRKRGQVPTENRLNPEEMKRQLAPLFESASPNLGYFCLASLGRYRKTLVLNLNWDGMVESAAKTLGIPYQSLDIEDDPNEITATWDDMVTGLL